MAELMGKRFESADEVREFTDGKGRVGDETCKLLDFGGLKGYANGT